MKSLKHKLFGFMQNCWIYDVMPQTRLLRSELQQPATNPNEESPKMEGLNRAKATFFIKDL